MKKFKLFFISLFVFVMGITSVSASPVTHKAEVNSFKLSNYSNPGTVFAYASGHPAYTVFLADGSDVYYCLDFKKVAAWGGNYKKAELLGGSAGFAYLIEQNPYVKQASTQENYNITQLAMWLYAEKYAHGNTMTNMSDGYQSGVVAAAKELYNKAIAFNNTHAYYVEDADGNLVVTHKPDYAIDNTTNDPVLDGDYYYQQVTIKGTKFANLLNKYNLELDEADVSNGVYIANTSGTKISDASGKVVIDVPDNSTSVSFRIYIPSSLVGGDGKYTAKVYTNSNYYYIYKAYSYNANSYNQRLVSYGQDKDVAKHATTVTVSNKSGLRISKVDATDGEEIPGAKLELYRCSGTTKTDDKVTEWISTTEPHFESVEPGSYYLKETQTPSGYEAITESSDCFTVTADNITPVKMKNRLKLSSALILKMDSETKRLISGATLRIVDKATGEEKHRWTTSTAPLYINMSIGNAITLPEGEYYVEEVEAPAGYDFIADDVKEEFTITRDGGAGATIDGETIRPIYITLYNTKKPSKIKIAKVDDKGNYIAGAKLQILDSYGMPIDGMEFTSTTEPIEVELSYGSYYLYETKAPEGYEIAGGDENPKAFTVDNDGGKEKLITIINDLAPDVPDTFASVSKFIYFIGACAIIFGGYTLYRNKFSKSKK